MNNLQGKTVSNRVYIFLYMLLWAGFPLQDFATAIVIHIPILNSISEDFIEILIIASIIISIPRFVSNLKITDYFVYAAFASIFFINYSVFPDNRLEMEEIQETFLFKVLPFYLLGVCLDFNYLKKYLYWVSCATVYITFVYYVLLHKGVSEFFNDDVGSISAAYELLPHVVFMTWLALSDLKRIDIVGAIFGSFTLLSMGNRGSVLSLLIFIVSYFLFFKKFARRAYFYRGGIVAILAVLYSFIDYIFLAVMGLLTLFGMSTRVVMKMMSDDMVVDEARDKITEHLITAIKANPYTGYGICADRSLVDTYAHNIFIEFAVSFGIVATIIAFFILILMSGKALITSKFQGEKSFVIILISCCFKLVVSGSFLIDSMFFFMIGYLVHQIRANKTLTNYG